MIVGHIGGSSSGGYEIQKSLRFRASALAYLSRTPSVTGNQTTWALSVWIKRGVIGTQQRLLYVGNGTNSETSVHITGDQVQIEYYSSGNNYFVRTSAVLRDASAWYHLYVVWDTGNVTAADRFRIYINGSRSTNLSATFYPPAGLGSLINSNAYENLIGVRTGGSDYLDGYLSEINFIDGQALGPEYFGEFSSETGSWIPKKYTGTYGTNGFYLPFNDGSTLGNLTADRSGNGNNWTAINISLTSGVTYDWMDDTPTNNYAVLNQLNNAASRHTISQGNLVASLGTAADDRMLHGTVFANTGKWYFEYVGTGGTSICSVGVASNNAVTSGGGVPQANSVIYFGNGAVYKNGASQGTFTSYANGDVIGVAFDLDALTVALYKNNTLITTITGLTSDYYSAGVFANNPGDNFAVNFGQRPFAYTPPTGFKALCTKNLPEVPASLLDPTDHHIDITVTKSGDTNFTLPWDASVYDTFFEIKRRDASGDWYQIDGLRGYDKILKSNSTAAETTDANVLGVSGTTCTLKSTLPNGVYIISATKAGLSSARQTNTDGSITSTVSRNVPSGFSIVTWTGDLNAASTVGHGLGTSLKLLITHGRGAATEWMVKHAALASNFNLILNQTLAANSATATYSGGGLSNLGSSTTFGFLSGSTNCANANPSATMVAYCYADSAIQKSFSYKGNGSTDGPYVNLGFKCGRSLIKSSNLVSNWIVQDSVRRAYNVVIEAVYQESSVSENTTFALDITALGLKQRSANGAVNNSASDTYIGHAWAATTGKFSLAR